ncbi:Cyclin-C [Chionoecetes opilio]|uniref:Cyclin-C n=1 Tax=Chionoecetes opilio TaxID=41210 RepID=A0A8J4YG02_CHIOP|nr:Cyclin-C [Chionoecetes opilio]
MAGNFWQSAHYQQWILDSQDLIQERRPDLEVLTEEEYQKVMSFFSNFIQQLGETLKLRQQVIATATTFLKRFYARNSLRCIDPLLLAPTSVFLSSKVEEFGVISNSRLISTCQTVVKNKFSYAYTSEFPYRTNHILECEFYLLESLDCCLIVYQPYRVINMGNRAASNLWLIDTAPIDEITGAPSAYHRRSRSSFHYYHPTGDGEDSAGAGRRCWRRFSPSEKLFVRQSTSTLQLPLKFLEWTLGVRRSRIARSIEHELWVESKPAKGREDRELRNQEISERMLGSRLFPSGPDSGIFKRLRDPWSFVDSSQRETVETRDLVEFLATNDTAQQTDG